MGDDGVNISSKEMYDKICSIDDEVREMRSEIRAVTDHESRIRSLEQRLWVGMGMAVVFASGLGAGLAQVIPGA